MKWLVSEIKGMEEGTTDNEEYQGILLSDKIFTTIAAVALVTMIIAFIMFLKRSGL